MRTKPAIATRLRGIWLGVKDFDRSRSFYERIGARFDAGGARDGILYATLGDTRLVFEAGAGTPPGTGPFLLFDVTDADVLHSRLQGTECTLVGPPEDRPWGRQLNVIDPDGYSIALIGPPRE